MVTVQLPVFNERHVVARLLDAVCQLEWPSNRFEVQVLDDSTDDTTQLLTELVNKWKLQGVNIELIHRDHRTGFKAGALDYGLQKANGEFVALFDADFVPESDFLHQMMPHFDRPKIGMVQARWGHLNHRDGLLTAISAHLLDGHFVLEHTARHRSGRFFNFNGTAGIWRIQCVTDAGGWQHDTLTEDVDLSYRAQLSGWQFVYRPEIVVASELPDNMRAFKVQQHRWAKGTIQTARKLLRLILCAPIHPRIKLEALVHLTSNFAYPMVLLLALLLPLRIAMRDIAGWDHILVWDLLAFGMTTGSVMCFYGLAHREVSGSALPALKRIPMLMALGIGLSVNQTKAVIEGLFGNDVTFQRTPKKGSVQPASTNQAAPFHWTTAVELALATYLGTATVWALWAGAFASVPFVLLFATGFAYVGFGNLYTDSPIWGRHEKGLGTINQSGPLGAGSSVASIPTRRSSDAA